MRWSMYLAQSNAFDGWIPLGAALLVVLTLFVTLLVVFAIWRDGYRRGWRKAREKPPTCVDCGYNMSGLTQCRCPECGKEYTLDRLWQIAIYSRRPAKTEEEHKIEPSQETESSR